MLENHSKSSVIGDRNAPFMTHLAHKFQMASRYYGVTHPSMPNYIASIAGDNFGIQDDNSQNIVRLNRPNLVGQLQHRHIGWGAYMEDLPKNKLAQNGPGDQALYAKKHDPFVLFANNHTKQRMSHVRPYSRLAHDLNRTHPPQFVWITPNQCHDMHGGIYTHIKGHPETPCPYGSTKDDPNDAALKHKADRFVRHAVHTIRSSRAWTRHSAIVIVTDENDYTGNPETDGWESAAHCCDSPYVEAKDPRLTSTDANGNPVYWRGGTYGGGLVPAIIVSPQAPRHLVVGQKYNHYSLLTTIEQNWHLGLLGHAGDRRGGVYPMWRVFLG